MKNKVLVIAPHPDDETLGAGGTLLKHKMHKDKVYWLIATSMKEEGGYNKRKIINREKEVTAVARSYDFDEICRLNLATTKVDKVSISDIIEKMSIFFKKIRPNIIYIPFYKDVHSDHRIIFDAAQSCIKTFRCPYISKVLMMEIQSETEFAPSIKDSSFIPNYFVDITDYLRDKIKIMRIYKSQLGLHPFPRSIKGIKSLAAIRGVQAGCKFAEGFMLLKEIQ